MHNTIVTIIKEASAIFAPLALRLSEGRAGLYTLLQDIGLPVDEIVDQRTLDGLQQALAGFESAYEALRPFAGIDAVPSLEDVPRLLAAIKTSYDVLMRLNSVESGMGGAMASAAAVSDLGKTVLAHLIVERLRYAHLRLFAVLYQFGVISPGNPRSEEAGERLTKLSLQRVSQLIRDPAVLLKKVVKWGQGSPDIYRCLASLQHLFLGYGWPAVVALPEASQQALLGGYTHGNSPDAQLRIPFDLDLAAITNSGVAFQPLRDSDNELDGVAIIPYGFGGMSRDFVLGETGRLSYVVSAGAGAGLMFLIRVGELSLRSLDNASSPVSNARIAITLQSTSEQPPIVIGQSDIAALQLSHFSFRLQLVQQSATLECVVELEIKRAKFSFHPAKADGFISTLLPEEAIETEFETTIGWSNRRGLYLRGGAGLEIALPVHPTKIGPLSLNALRLAVRADEEQLALAIAADAAATVGPLTIVVQGVGLKACLGFPNGGGNLGPLDVAFRFLPPEGVGVVVDAGSLTGGGYLRYDEGKREYSGALQLEFADKLSLKAVGILSTVMPDGSTDKFSLLIIITGEFPPVQIGFGFTLNGVGGLLGLHRVANPDALGAGIKNGTLDSILFPADPINNIQRIISDLQSVFPAREGRHLIGPLAKLGWGTPSLATFELGLVLELPDPVKLLILGTVRMELPKPGAGIILFQMAIFGEINFSTREAKLLADLYGSKIVGYKVDGGMGMLVRWGQGPTFVLSIGGFNRHFSPPVGFDVPHRLRIPLRDGKNLKLSFKAYFALTSNTVQFGARADFYAAKKFTGIGRFSASAHLSVDALVRLRPRFYVVFSIEGGVTIKHGGDTIAHAQVEGMLSGPRPWHAHGKVTVHFHGKHSISFDKTFGSKASPPKIATAVPLEHLAEALGDRHAWSAQVLADDHSIVTIRKISIRAGEVLIHPAGAIAFRQSILPLDLEIEKVHGSYLSARQTFMVTVSLSGHDPFINADALRDQFAPGQFLELSDAKQLSSPAFESLPCGYSYGGTAGHGNAQKKEWTYRTIAFDEGEEQPRLELARYPVRATVLERLAGSGAAGQSPIRASGRKKFAGPSSEIAVKEPEFAVVEANDLLRYSAAPSQFATNAEGNAWRRKMGLGRDRFRVLEAFRLDVR